jgi:glycosyltransferase involved in cell wall biosynthesis
MTLRNLRYFEGLLDVSGARIVHTNGDAGMPVAVAAYHRGIPIVHHARKFYGANPPYVLAFSAKNIAISDAIAQDLRRCDVTAERIARIYNGVDIGRFSQAKHQWRGLRRDLGLAGKRVVTLIARISAQKRQDELIRAMPSVLALHPNAVCLLVGEVEEAERGYWSRIQRLVGDLGLNDKVIFHGFEPQIERVHAVSDVLVLCTMDEPFGRCLLEAMAAGVPIVAPNRGGPTEFLANGRSGMLYTPGDEQHLARCIQEVLTDRKLRRRIVREARLKASAFSVAEHLAALTDVYDELLAIGTTGTAIRGGCPADAA